MRSNPLKQPCTRCGSTAWERLDRRGFFQERLLPFFNLYPWRCAICNRQRYLSIRHDPERALRELNSQD